MSGPAHGVALGDRPGDRDLDGAGCGAVGGDEHAHLLGQLERRDEEVAPAGTRRATGRSRSGCARQLSRRSSLRLGVGRSAAGVASPSARHRSSTTGRDDRLGDDLAVAVERDLRCSVVSDSQACMSAVRPYAAKMSPSPCARSVWAPGSWLRTAPSMRRYGASSSTEIAAVSVLGPWKTVRWAMPAPIIRAASTNAATAHTKRTNNTSPGAREGCSGPSTRHFRLAKTT